MVGKCECAYCMHDLDFALDDFLVKEIESGNAVIFAGAGISTENPNSSVNTLYAEFCAELGLSGNDMQFADLCQRYAEQPDGSAKLMRRIQDRFDLIDSFASLQQQATKFYKQLATMPHFHTFVTTNWDRYFEDLCKAKPFVYEQDMRFWGVPHRRVLKIHGTIDDYSSLVATRDDYRRCEARLHTSLVGSKLKDILTTNTCIFIGYSLKDEDFQEIFRFVREAHGKFQKTHYIVGPSAHSSSSTPHLIPIKTDGTYFLSILKAHFDSSPCYVSDKIFEDVDAELADLVKEHGYLWETVSPRKSPQMLAAAMYQDGLIHGYQNILAGKSSGRYSHVCWLLKKAKSYNDKISFYLTRKKYLEVAYFRGYQDALLSLIFSKEEGEAIFPGHYYFEKAGNMTRDDFISSIDALPTRHKAAYKECERAAAGLPKGEFVLQHLPWG